jgi:heme exporter protein D
VSYVWAGYSVTLLGLGTYTVWLLRRARALARGGR